jgi:hypothetical protein
MIYVSGFPATDTTLQDSLYDCGLILPLRARKSKRHIGADAVGRFNQAKIR